MFDWDRLLELTPVSPGVDEEGNMRYPPHPMFTLKPNTLSQDEIGHPPPPIISVTNNTLSHNTGPERAEYLLLDHHLIPEHLDFPDEDKILPQPPHFIPVRDDHTEFSLDFFRVPQPAHRPQITSVLDAGPIGHALPAAYAMWRDVARIMSEKAMRLDEEDFQNRKRRAAIMMELEYEKMQKSLLDTAKDEYLRNQELLLLQNMAYKDKLMMEK